MTQAEYLAYQVRQQRIAPYAQEARTPDCVSFESELHDQIIAECRRRSWPYVHSRMDQRSTVAVGVADFIILRDGGSPLIIECKRKGSKATPAQQAFLAHCRKNGYVAGIVRSFEEFLHVCVTGKFEVDDTAPAVAQEAHVGDGRVLNGPAGAS